MFKEWNVSISFDEIKGAFNQIRQCASSGRDFLLNKFLKKMLEWITYLFAQ